MSRRPRAAVYIAGPITNDPVGNTRRGLVVWHDLLDRGFAPLLPHFDLFAAMIKERDYEELMALDFEWLRRSDAVLRLPGESPGADREVALAESIGIPVFFDVEALEASHPPR